MKSPLFFIHGGPGLNTFPERALLGPLLDVHGIKAYFWNEPSALRPDADKRALLAPSFTHWLASAEDAFLEWAGKHGKIHLLGQSFGAHAAIHISRKHPSLVEALTLIAPALDLHEVQKKICRLSVMDFRQKDPANAEKIENLLNTSRFAMDAPMEAAFSLALQNPLLLTHYWHHQNRMQEWMSCLTGPDAQIDLNSLFGVSRTFEPSHLKAPQAPLDDFPVQLLFGNQDPIVDRTKESSLARILYENVRDILFDKAGHFPHLEHPVDFVEGPAQWREKAR